MVLHPSVQLVDVGEELPVGQVADLEGVEELPVAIPLLQPVAGVPLIIDTEDGFDRALAELAVGRGPFAFDAERASGYKYSARAYLIQIKRTGGGLHLIDPIAFGPGHRCFIALNELISQEEVILHASTQDLPCLREVGIFPQLLFDTELGGRIAGLARVGLGPLLETLMSVSLAKEHSAVDWSKRPLPADWLNYAALDVELLIELRGQIYQLLVDSGKWSWAQEDFAAILESPPAAPRIDPWRRTSGMHKVKKRNQLAVIRELWQARNELAQDADISPSRLLSDAAITALALACDKDPITNRKHLEQIFKPLGLRARWLDNAATWISCITDAIAMSEDQWPAARSTRDVLPPIKVWRERFPERYAPLTHARHNLSLRASELSIPLENMISPELVRRICWQPPASGETVYQALVASGSRRWQAEIAAPILEVALRQSQALEPVGAEEAESEE